MTKRLVGQTSIAFKTKTLSEKNRQLEQSFLEVTTDVCSAKKSSETKCLALDASLSEKTFRRNTYPTIFKVQTVCPRENFISVIKEQGVYKLKYQWKSYHKSNKICVAISVPKWDISHFWKKFPCSHKFSMCKLLKIISILGS